MRKYTSLIVGLSSLFTVAYIIICFTDPNFKLNGYLSTGVIFVSVWIFFIIPAYRYYYLIHLRMVKEEQHEKLYLSFMFHKISMILPLLFAPAYGIVYYVNVLRDKNE